MTKTELKLIEKITEAKLALGKIGSSHSDFCPVEADPEGYAPCNCGASRVNLGIQCVIDILSLKDIAED